MQKVNNSKKIALKITMIYIGVSIAWILFSDMFLSEIAKNTNSLAHALMVHNWFFVIATGLLLNRLIYFYVSALSHSEEIREQAEKKAQHMARFDSVTDLPNANLLREILEEEIEKTEFRPLLMLASLSVNLKNFKQTSNAVGRDDSDLLLAKVALRIQESLRKGDRCGRVGDHEFGVVLPSLKDGQNTAAIAHRIVEQVSKPFDLNEGEIYLSACVGISIYPNDGDNADNLSANAHAAMHVAKGAGRDNIAFYAQELLTKAVDRLALEQDLRQAIEDDQFVGYYQPCVDTNTGKIISAEALVRWDHPQKGMIFPDEFIPIAEENGLIVEIGEFMLRTSCAQHMNWQRAGLDPVHLSINLSPRQFEQHDLVHVIEDTAEKIGLDPRFLGLEITESVIMNDPQNASRVLSQLKEIGLRILIDDFGTGYSSLQALKILPIDGIKIDQSFVKDLATDPHCAVIVKAMISMAHIMEIKVTAEGVETLDQYELLRSLKCDAVQGFYFAPALPSDDFIQLLGEGPVRAA
ncbi:MAG TPA: GGDEF domain-containing protein [Actinobacteria bacterium]|nr:GGDEF domain-containing protein [Actinomycetota bacterium]